MGKKDSQAVQRVPSCDMPAPACTPKAEKKSAIRRHKGNFTWKGVKTQEYKNEGMGWAAISRNVLSGIYGEKTKFHVRYFEIAPKGYSSLEAHRHEHVVICVRGRGRITLGSKTYVLRHLDVAYVAPDEEHQLLNPYGEPFGFLCMVDAKRDRPRPVAAPRKSRSSRSPGGKK